LEISILVTFPKRWLDFVAAIHGQMGGHAMLGADSCTSFFFLRAMIFCSSDLALKAPAQPSGFIPG
jgi:hypothetical protein